jgi:hypothetical protein
MATEEKSGFLKALDVITGILSGAGVLAPILAALGVAVPPAAVAAVPATVTMMKAAEEALGDGTGLLKKAAVTKGAVAFVEGMQEVSTGGQKETWERVTPEAVGATVDVIAGVANQIAEAFEVDDVFDASTFVYTGA